MWGGQLDAFTACMHLTPQVVLTLCLRPIRCALLESSYRRPHVYGVGVHLVVFVSAMVLRLNACVRMEAGILQHRFFLITTIAVLLFMTAFFYVPGRIWFFIEMPCYFVCWLTFHYKVTFLTRSCVVTGLCACGLGTFARNMSYKLTWENFQMTRELKMAHDSLQQVLAAQEVMLASLFDASCICDADGGITSAAPQMEQLLAGEGNIMNVLGVHFASFATSNQEAARIQSFLQQVAQSVTPHALTIQTSLSKWGCPVVSMTDQEITEAKLFCIRLPGSCDSASLEAHLWAHRGLFIGLQVLPQINSDVKQKRDNPILETVTGFSDASLLEPTPQGLRIMEFPPQSCLESASSDGTVDSIAITFDAGTPRLTMLSFSPLFIDKACGLLDLLPKPMVEHFDDWVVKQVQEAPAGRRSKSTTMVESLQFNLPPRLGVTVDVQAAWLEIPATEVGTEEALPVTLWLEGANLRNARGTAGCSSGRRRMEAVLERPGAPSDDDVTIRPEDSISDCGLLPRFGRVSYREM